MKAQRNWRTKICRLIKCNTMSEKIISLCKLRAAMIYYSACKLYGVQRLPALVVIRSSADSSRDRGVSTV